MGIISMFLARVEMYYEIQDFMFWIKTLVGGFYG